MEIVYCGGCGRVLRREDFDRGLASRIDNRPWCSDCKPSEKASGPGAGSSSRRQVSTGKHGRIGVGTARRDIPASRAPRTALLGIGAAVVLGVLILAAIFAGTSAPRNPEKPPRSDAGPERDVAASAEAQRLLRELQTLASLAPPDRVLARCEELRAKFVGLPEDKGFQEIQNAAKELKRAKDQGSQLTKELDALQKLIDEDPRYSRSEEIVRRFQAARDIAGGRAAEVERRLAAYQKERKAAPFEKHAGPFSEDDQGFIRHWLILGVFPNDNDKGFDVDFLKTESTHEPIAGLAVGKLSWAAYDSSEWKI